MTTCKKFRFPPRLIKNRLEKYEKAIDGINKRKFEPAPSDNNCPYCPHFFICPSGDLKYLN